MRVGVFPRLSQIELEEAEDFVHSVTEASRNKAETYQRTGAVRDLRCVLPNQLYTAQVAGTRLYRVKLEFDGEFWSSSCSCPFGVDCSHGIATMLELLRREESPHAAATTEPPPPDRIEDALRQRLGRPFTNVEIKFIRRIADLYQRATWQRVLLRCELRNLIPHMRGSGWEPLDLWSKFPSTEFKFWRYVIWAIRNEGGAVPDDLAAASDPDEIARAVKDHQRDKRLRFWQDQIQSHANHLQQTAIVNSSGDIRLVIGPEQLIIECRNGPDQPYTVVKPTKLKKMIQDYQEKRLVLTPESLAVWHPICLVREIGYSSSLNYQQPHIAHILNALLRQPSLHERIVGANRQPLVRHPEPLRWQLIELPPPDDDYRLRLVQADGRDHPPILLTLPGHPTLYLTTDDLFTGPPVWANNQTGSKDVDIPAPVIESQDGAKFLLGLGVPFPPRLQNRIEPDTMRVVADCRIGTVSMYQTTETLQIKFTAQSEKTGSIQTFGFDSWTPTKTRDMKRTDPEKIYLTDHATLEAVPKLLESLGANWDPYQQTWQIRIGKDFANKFANWLRQFPPQIQPKLHGELESFLQNPITATLRLDCEPAGIDWFDLRVILNVADTELTTDELKLLLNARGGFVRLKDKGWRRLEFNLAEDDNQSLAKLGLNANDFSAEPQRLHALQLADTAAQRFLPQEQVTEIKRRAGEIQTRVTPPVPDSVRAELRPYQVEGYHFLAYLSANRFGGILADDMGLGKTLQAITWLNHLRQQPNPSTRVTLVVCPKSVTDNWRAESERFTTGVRVRIWHTNNNGNTVADAIANTDILVINYAQLRNLQDQLARIHWLAVILDEGQYIKNPQSQTARAACALKSDHRLVLTGTPIENRLLDLWSLMSFAMPGVLGNRASFARNFSQENDPLARRRLSARVRPFLLRRTKNQVARELPDRIEEDLLCEMDGLQQTLYRAELKRAQQMLLRVNTAADLDRDRFNFLASLLRLRQICCHPALVDEKRADAESAKLNALVETLEPLMEEDNKVLVFSQFVSMLDIIQPVLVEKGWPHFMLTGSTENRGDLVASFQKTDGPAVFLISLKAGGFGLNLTAASYVVLFDPWWNPAVENQAIDRTHRIGQINKVIAYRLLIKNSIEEKIRSLQRSKRALAEDVLGEENFAQAMSIEDLRYLFADD